MSEIEIRISKRKMRDNITIEGHNFQGQACQKDINEIMELLKGTTTSRKMKPEYVRTIDNIQVKR